ncbi:MAG: hypothetical protein K9K80_02050 [Spirochaetia bacterium]|nr:hypothetical protein [Spirochaetia bacterium]
MKISKAKGYLESTKLRVNIGSFFMDKSREDFDSDEAYDAACELAEANEWIEFRQPTVDEIKSIKKGGGLPDGLDLTDPKILITVLEYTDSKEDTKQFDFLASMMEKCIVGSSFVDDNDKEAKSSDIMVMVRSQGYLFGKVVEGFTSLMGK